MTTVFSSNATAQESIRTYHGQPTLSVANDAFGHACAAVGDVDGDGVVDLVVGARYEDRIKARRKDGAVYLMSGASGTELRSHVGGSFDELGTAVVGGADFDGDGVGDYAATRRVDLDIVDSWSGVSGVLLWQVSAAAGEDFTGPIAAMPDFDRDGCRELGLAGMAQSGSTWVHSLFVISGRTGSRLASYVGGANGITSAITSACTLGDLNGDGVQEFAVGWRGTRGHLDVVDGATQGWIATLDGEWNGGESFGGSCGRIGDLNLDGIDDIAVADPAFGALDEGRMYVLSGSTLSTVFTIDTPDPLAGPNFGLVASDAKFDANGDGWPDIASGSGGWLLQPPNFKYSIAAVFSGRTGRLLYQWRGEYYAITGDEHLGWSLAVGDVDGDGLGDILPGAEWNATPTKSGGVIHAFAGNDLFLQTNQLVYFANDPIDVFTRGGDPGEWTLLALTDVNGTPTFDEIALTQLDSFGESTWSDVTPSGLAGMTFTIQAWATRAGRRGLATSSPATVELQ